MSNNTITMIAKQIKTAFATGKPYTMPMMTVRDLGRVLMLLDEIEYAA